MLGDLGGDVKRLRLKYAGRGFIKKGSNYVDGGKVDLERKVRIAKERDDAIRLSSNVTELVKDGVWLGEGAIPERLVRMGVKEK